MTNKQIRDGAKNDDKAIFFTSFNTSSIYATAGREGDALIQVAVAIEYPSLYKDETNWLQTSALVKVVEELSVSIPKFNRKPFDSTHLFLMPKNSAAKIETNR